MAWRKRVPVALYSFAVAASSSRPAFAGPGGEPLVSFGNELLEFLTATLGPILFMLGLAIGGISLLFGSRDGVQKAVWAVIGGALLFSVKGIMYFVQRAAG